MYEEHYKAKSQLIGPIRKKYEKYNEELEVAVEEIENEVFDDMYDDIDREIINRGMSQVDKDEYGIFDPDRPEEHRQYDIGHDIGLGLQRYTTEVHASHCEMTHQECLQIMQSLNLRQSEICTDVMQWFQTKTDPMHIFIEGGAGVGKTKVARSHS